MSIQKITFSSSLLDKNINKPVELSEDKSSDNEIKNNAPDEQAQPEISENKNNKVRNWSIGLSAAAVLVGLGVAGRKGKLGKNIQKMLGGIKKINIDAINARLNRTIPEFPDDILRLDKIPFSEYTDLSKVKTAEVTELPNALAQVHILPNEYKQVLYADKNTKLYKSYIVMDESNKNILVGCLDKDGELTGLSSEDGTYMICYGKEKMVRVIKWVKKQIDKNTSVMYHSNGDINYYSVTENGINKSIMFDKTADGKLFPKYITYKDVEKDVKIKTELLDDNGKNIVYEQFFDESGNLVKTLPEG